MLKFDFDINQPEVQYVKCGSTLTGKSSHLVKIAGDGHCFFCSISFHLTGNQFQHYKICQHICDFIESKDNLSKLRAFLGHHNTGEDYVLSSKMRQQSWATEVEMISLAPLTGKDLVFYYNQKWQWHPASDNGANPTINAFYMDNSSGGHFDAVVGLWKFLPSNFLSSQILPSLFLSWKNKNYILVFVVPSSDFIQYLTIKPDTFVLLQPKIIERTRYGTSLCHIYNVILIYLSGFCII